MLETAAAAQEKEVAPAVAADNSAVEGDEGDEG